jgi:hypothetical protein
MTGAAVTPTTVQVIDVKSDVVYGTAVRLVDIYVVGTSANAADTINLATYVPSLTGILSVEEMLDGAQNGGTANTWSTTTITFAGHSGSGVWVMCIRGYY